MQWYWNNVSPINTLHNVEHTKCVTARLCVCVCGKLHFIHPDASVTPRIPTAFSHTHTTRDVDDRTCDYFRSPHFFSFFFERYTAWVTLIRQLARMRQPHRQAGANTLCKLSTITGWSLIMYGSAKNLFLGRCTSSAGAVNTSCSPRETSFFVLDINK